MGELYLCLCCHGRSTNGFVSCPSVCNKILKIDNTIDDLNDFVKYIKATKLDERPILDSNAARGTISSLKKYFRNGRPIWSNEFMALIDNFNIEHRKCGVYVKLESFD